MQVAAGVTTHEGFGLEAENDNTNLKQKLSIFEQPKERFTFVTKKYGNNQLYKRDILKWKSPPQSESQHLPVHLHVTAFA